MRVITNITPPDNTIHISEVTQMILLRGSDNPQVVYFDGMETYFLRQVNSDTNRGKEGSQWAWIGAGSNNRLSQNFNTIGDALAYIDEDDTVMYFDDWREAYRYLLNEGH